MSLTNGSFSPALIADLNKGLASLVSEFTTGAPFSNIAAPFSPQQGVTVFNVSGNLVRGTATYVPGTVFTGPAAQQAFLIPAGGTFSVDLSDDGSGDYAAFASILFEVVTPPAPGAFIEISTLAAAPAAQPGQLIVNYATD